MRSTTAFYAVSKNDARSDVVVAISATRTLRRGISCDQNTGRLPVDVDAELSWRIPAETGGVLSQTEGNPLVTCRKQGQTSDHAFSPTGNSASLKGTPQPPIPQYPL